MKKVVVFSLLLIAGMVGSQLLPDLVGTIYEQFRPVSIVLIMVALAFIMIHVGYEFDLDQRNLRQYGWDYVVAMTAAAFPWLFVCLCFVCIMLPVDIWNT